MEKLVDKILWFVLGMDSALIIVAIAIYVKGGI